MMLTDTCIQRLEPPYSFKLLYFVIAVKYLKLKLTILTICSVQFSNIESIYIVVQLSQPLIHITLHFVKLKFCVHLPHPSSP